MRKLMITLICSFIFFAFISDISARDRIVGGGISHVSPLSNDLSDRLPYINNGLGIDTEAQFKFADNNVFVYLGLSWFTANGGDLLMDSLGIDFGYSALQIELGGKLYFAEIDKFTAFAGLYFAYNTNTHLSVDIADNTSGFIDDRFYESQRSVNVGFGVGISYPIRKNEYISLEGKIQSFPNSIFQELTKITLKYNFNLAE